MATVAHKPIWLAGPLRIDKAGNTKPGFWCIHPMENGNGLCGGNVFEIDPELDTVHYCGVPDGVAHGAL
jgi:hypothetical protein